MRRSSLVHRAGLIISLMMLLIFGTVGAQAAAAAPERLTPSTWQEINHVVPGNGGLASATVRCPAPLKLVTGGAQLDPLHPQARLKALRPIGDDALFVGAEGFSPNKAGGIFATLLCAPPEQLSTVRTEPLATVSADAQGNYVDARTCRAGTSTFGGGASLRKKGNGEIYLGHFVEYLALVPFFTKNEWVSRASNRGGASPDVVMESTLRCIDLPQLGGPVQVVGEATEPRTGLLTVTAVCPPGHVVYSGGASFSGATGSLRNSHVVINGTLDRRAWSAQGFASSPERLVAHAHCIPENQTSG